MKYSQRFREGPFAADACFFDQTSLRILGFSDQPRRGDYNIPTRLRMIHSTVSSKTIGTNHQ